MTVHILDMRIVKVIWAVVASNAFQEFRMPNNSRGHDRMASSQGRTRGTEL
jgi:hypothetical protein